MTATTETKPRTSSGASWTPTTGPTRSRSTPATTAPAPTSSRYGSTTSAAWTRTSNAHYQWAGGPKGYPKGSDLPAGIGGRQVLLTGTDWGNNNVTRPEMHHVLGDNWDSNRDEDWIGVDLEQGGIYTVRLRTKNEPAREAPGHGVENTGHERRQRERHQRHRQRRSCREESLRNRLDSPQHRPLPHRRGFRGQRPDRHLLAQHHEGHNKLTEARHNTEAIPSNQKQDAKPDW